MMFLSTYQTFVPYLPLFQHLLTLVYGVIYAACTPTHLASVGMGVLFW